MRSSVSAMLTKSGCDTVRSRPDYDQSAIDHAAIAILLRADRSSQPFLDEYMSLSSSPSACFAHKSFMVNDKFGPRPILVRFLTDYWPDNNCWGDFQSHRKLFGVITISECLTKNDLIETCKLHRSFLDKYQQTVIDSRLVVNELPAETGSEISPCVRYWCGDGASRVQFEELIGELVGAIFFVLDSKRLTKRTERIPLVLAPFELKEFLTVETESKQFKKRCLGRWEKQNADLHLQLGLLSDAFIKYGQAADILKSVNDWLWLAAAQEGAAIACYLLESDALKKLAGATSASTTSGSAVNLAPLMSADDMLKKYREAIANYAKYQNAAIIELEACFKAAEIATEFNLRTVATSILQNALMSQQYAGSVSSTAASQQQVQQMAEAEKIARFEKLAVAYKRLKMERKSAFCLRLAASRHVSPQNSTPNWSLCYNLMLRSLHGYKIDLEPLEMLRKRNVGWSALQVQLMQDIVVAAKRMGQSALATRHMTYLLQTMWPRLTRTQRVDFCEQLQTLASQCEGSPVLLVVAGSGLAIPAANLIHVPECMQFAVRPLSQALRPRLIDVLMAANAIGTTTSPFLFTPIQFGGGSSGGGGGGSAATGARGSSSQNEIEWVENEKGSIDVRFRNDLELNLIVHSMRILTSGNVVFETIPESIRMVPGEIRQLTLTGIPKESGELKIDGYSTHTLGVKSDCRLMATGGAGVDSQIIKVVPSLPTLEIQPLLPPQESSDSRNVQYETQLEPFNGESIELSWQLCNCSDLPIEWLVLDQKKSSALEFVHLPTQTDLTNHLPLAAHSSVTIPIHVSFAQQFLNYQRSQCAQSIRTESNSSTILSFQRNESFRSNKSNFELNRPFETIIQVKYSGGDGYKCSDRYCRMSSVLMRIHVLPSVQIVQWDILPAENYHQFYLILDIVNLIANEIEIEYAPKKRIIIENDEKCRVPIVCDRCPLAKLAGCYSDAVTVPEICSKHVAEQIHVKWTLLSPERRHGSVSVPALPLTSAMLEQIKMPPIEYDLYWNETPIQLHGNYCCVCNQRQNIRIEILNRIESQLINVAHKIDLWFDFKNGERSYDMHSKVLFCGTTKFYETQMEASVGQTYRTSAIFLKPGTYKFTLSYRFETKQQIVDTTAQSLSFPVSTACWKELPAIDITVN